MERFRTLLRLYYAGETSPQQERELMTSASAIPEDDIPTDLIADVSMLRDMASLSDGATGFGKFLDDLPGQEPTVSVGRRPRRLLWISAAASLTLLLSAGGFALFRNSTETDNRARVQRIQVASASHAVKQNIPASESLSESPGTDVVVADKKKATLPRQAAKARARMTAPSEAETQEESKMAYIEITDPEEAAKILDSTFILLSDNLRTAQSSIEITEQSLTKTSETLNTIL